MFTCNMTVPFLISTGKVSYTCQDAWIQNQTLQGNITMGETLRKDLYDACLRACCLRPDIAELAGGDQAEIGEKGVNLSGGQRARVSLARACYAGEVPSIANLSLQWRGSHHFNIDVMSNIPVCILATI